MPMISDENWLTSLRLVLEVLMTTSYEHRVYQIMKHRSTEVCKNSGNRMLKLTKNGKSKAVHLQILERGGKKGCCPFREQA